MYDKSQLMRGTLEGCILKFLSEETTYGYELVERLEQNGFQDIKEGTIYPLLVRLEKKGIIRSEFRPSPLGPSRKYYSLTPDGFEYLQEFTENWKQIEASVNQIFRLEE
ncbi:PadR family transcriptional regulator [Mordavella massiliensis]|jgi:PadR family transcriptional regulator PadR|uniref:PadR family transcriptional regulator n=1 Tax=Mordavella massiliensis TaxID=1871024 RepID=A0A939BBK3_9CLOT|nr:PadR family transcriptional regulator [Mordavella massiliensis]MBM6826480.1 PadR family transcriptional regulator [Mordavella massiliensis]MBM6971066.1 PadR family transcriptional regulator [Mordavella massiliensis]HJB86398.1 PadR family transcriptional regulator [Candidatus Dorea faecigallinarum]